MKRPTVNQAHAICDSLDARAVIVVALSKDGVAAASYGATKGECRQAGYTMDRIIEALEDGRIPVWETPESLEMREKRIIREAVAEGTYCPNCKVPWADCDCDRRDVRLDDADDLGL